MKLQLNRTKFSEVGTEGKLIVDGEEFCDTLEQVARPVGEKVPNKTCIPPGTYPIELGHSRRNGRTMPIVKNVKGFQGVLMHAGNTVSDTRGCILVGKKGNQDFYVSNSRNTFNRLYSKLVDAKNNGEGITLTVNGGQTIEEPKKEEKPVSKEPVSKYEFKGEKGEQTTFDEFFQKLKDEKKILVGTEKKDFLEYSWEGVSNFEKIVKMYTQSMKDQYKSELKQGAPPLVLDGTVVFLPNKLIEQYLQKVAGSDLFLKQESSMKEPYWSNTQKKMTENIGYVAFVKQNNEQKKGVSSNTALGKDDSNVIAQQQNLEVKVWIYSKAMKKLYNISKWIVTMNTTKNFDIGNFAMMLTPTEDLDVTQDVEHFSLKNDAGGINRDWFSNYIQRNDLVFLRYERLVMEGIKDELTKTAEVDLSRLKDCKWDMIGLVDTVSMSANFENTDYSVTVAGRDLGKLFIEDGSYFIPLKYVEGSKDRWFYGGNPETSWFKRNCINGNFDYCFMYEFQKIKNYLWFIIDQLSCIEIVDSQALSSCALREKKLSIELSEKDSKEINNEVNGIWKIIQAYVDPTLEDRRIVDRSLINPEGTLLDLIHKICQEPFVEVFGDTWGSGYELIVRQPPFTQTAIKKIIEGNKFLISIDSIDVLSMDLSYDDRAYSWYRLMPQNGWTGNNLYSSLAWVPIIFFEEFTKRFGNSRCIINDIYISEESLKGYDSEGKLSNLSKKLLNDLLFVVETSAYFPFTRKGTITINGDRRIKVGTFVFLAVTGEIFYVKSVSNSISFTNGNIERTTTIEVERGMLREYIDKYFQLVDVKKIREVVAEAETKKEDSNSQSSTQSSQDGVNKEIWDFFIERQMFKTENRRSNIWKLH